MLSAGIPTVSTPPQAAATGQSGSGTSAAVSEHTEVPEPTPGRSMLCCAVLCQSLLTSLRRSFPWCLHVTRPGAPHSVGVPAVLCCAAPVGSCVRVLTSQTSCVTCLGFSPDGQQLAAGTEDGTVAVYDLGSARRYASDGVCSCVSGPTECRAATSAGRGRDACSRSVRRTKCRGRIQAGKLWSKGARREQPSCPLPGRQLACCRLLRMDLRGCNTSDAPQLHTPGTDWTCPCVVTVCNVSAHTCAALSDC